MATNNSIDSLDPIQVALGGLGTSTLAADGVLYGNGTAAVGVTTVGTSGQVLAGNTGGAPSFQTIAVSPEAIVLIQTQNVVSPVASVNFTTGISNTYNNYLLICSNVVTTQIGGGGLNQASLGAQVSINGGSTYINSGYAYTIAEYSTYQASGSDNASTRMFMSTNIGSTPTPYIYAWFYNLANSTMPVSCLSQFTSTSVSSIGKFRKINNTIVPGGSVNAITLFGYQTGGTSTISGLFSLYGVKD